jgi:hypothetical protein
MNSFNIIMVDRDACNDHYEKPQIHITTPPFTVRLLNPVPGQRGETDPADLLPASYRTGKDDIATTEPTLQFLATELSVDRLNIIHKWLWIVGRPMPPRTLQHQYGELGREIVITEDMDMHLVWTSGKVFLKPIPRFLLDPDFWTAFILCRSNGHQKEHSYCSAEPSACQIRQRIISSALGYLHTYSAMIMYESDFRLAKNSGLIPDDVDWYAWKRFVQQLLAAHSFTLVNPRFHYGELRLGRLNKIYRVLRPERGSFIKGYSATYNNYSSFMSDYFAYIASFGAYVAIVLTAMQVGLATTELQGNSAFESVSYGFTVFSIIGPPALMLGVLGIFMFAFVFNWVATTNYHEKRFRQMGVWQDQGRRKRKKKDLENVT